NNREASVIKKKRKIVTRGECSDHGGTATRGMNGQLTRSGAKRKVWFEGGQMPLQRRIPKFGFTNIFKKEYQVVNLGSLQKLADEKKLGDVTLNAGELKKLGLIRSIKKPVKVLGDGNISIKVNLEVNAFSNSA